MTKKTVTQKCVDTSADVEAAKKMAQRLKEHLATTGVTITHTAALNALSASLGAANWRTLREKLNQPKRTKVAEAVEVTVAEWDVTKPRWSVHAVYADNNQRYSDDFFGATALEAQVNAQMDRLADSGWMTRIGVTCVIDRLTGKTADQKSMVSEAELMQESESINKLCEMATAKLGPPPMQGIEASDEYDRNMRAVEFWSTVCAGWNSRPNQEDPNIRKLRALIDDMAEEYSPNLSEYEDEEPVFTDSRGVSDGIDVADALLRVTDLASEGVDLTKTENAKETGVFQILQTRALMCYFGAYLKVVFNGETV